MLLFATARNRLSYCSHRGGPWFDPTCAHHFFKDLASHRSDVLTTSCQEEAYRSPNRKAPEIAEPDRGHGGAGGKRRPRTPERLDPQAEQRTHGPADADGQHARRLRPSQLVPRNELHDQQAEPGIEEREAAAINRIPRAPRRARPSRSIRRGMKEAGQSAATAPAPSRAGGNRDAMPSTKPASRSQPPAAGDRSTTRNESTLRYRKKYT